MNDTTAPSAPNMTATRHASLFRKCANPACTNEVHKQSKACKLCGTPSPWGAASAAPPVAQTDAGPANVAHPKEPVSAAVAGAVDQSKADGPKLVHFAPDPITHIVMRDFRHQFGDVMGVFKRGQVLTDFRTIASLKEAGSPIVPANEADAVACCPDCGKMFIPEAMPGGRKKVAG